MLAKKISFRVNTVKINEDGIDVQKGIESLLEEYKRNNYFDSLYNGCSDIEIKEKKLYVTEYQEQEFRGYIEECEYEGRKNYKVYIKDYKGECFHVGYVPFSKVPEIDEWINNNKLDMKGNFYILGGNIKYFDNNNHVILEQTKEYEFEVELRFYSEEIDKRRSKNSLKEHILKSWKIWVEIMAILIIIVIGTIMLLRNNMTPEETVSKFMYLVENKQYEDAKKLCSNKLEKLDIVSNLNPSNLTFTFSEDKKEATSILLEEEIESTNMNLRMKNTLMGWKIDSYEVVTDLTEPQVIEDRLKAGKTISDIQLLYWGKSDVASKEEITKYVTNNGMVALIFAETMKTKNYDKANEIYGIISEQDLTVDNLKEYNWDNYEIIDNFEIMKGPKGDLNSITVKLGDKKIWIYIAGKQIISVKQATTW